MIAALELNEPVPAWANWLAADADGLIYAYQVRPELYCSATRWAPGPRGDYAEIGKQTPCSGWQWSLTPADRLRPVDALPADVLARIKREAWVLGGSLAALVLGCLVAVLLK